ncbi:MAG: sigma-70 family RNA polymerase sigma factor [Ktedonobacteraceae bacterium]
MPTLLSLAQTEQDIHSHEITYMQSASPISTPEAVLQSAEEKPEQAEQRILVARALQGDEKAFGDIVDQYSALMLRTATMIVADHDIAEDVVQDAFIQAWHHLPDLREAGALRPWLMRIVVNQCISFKRRLARTTTFVRQALSEQEIDITAQIADHHKGRLERNWDIAHAIEGLPTKQRVVIVLHYYNGMTLPEMSQALQTSENTLKKRIQAALNNLRRVLRLADMDEGMASRASLLTASIA